ncbi:MAG: LuxR C-terminal-related transcriptional regulator [Syntrophomonas sp.]
MKKLKALKRARVNRALASIFSYPLTIVEAPIGYGKTTAVREFLAAKGSPVLWLSLLSAEDAAAFFWDRLAAEIVRVDEAAGVRLKSLGFPSDAPQTANILSILGDLDFEEKTALVIDDFHLVRGKEIGALLKQIVKKQPDNLHIVVITRDTTNLDFAELFAKGLCNILSQQLLRFTDGEIRDYCALMGFKPAEDEMEKICEYTVGWISLVYLVLFGMEQGIPVGRNSVIDELVEKVLYNTYDKSIQQFLLSLSVMDSFTTEQARHVTQEAKAEEFLKKLRRENAFVAFDESAGVYKIHNMLLDFLRTKHSDGSERAALYRRVGEWHLAQKALVPAYEYLCRAGETERILAILDDADNVTNYFAEFEGSLEMFAATPRELLYKYPIAYLQYIGLLLTSGDPETAAGGAARLGELQAVYEGTKNPPPERKSRILAEINAIRFFASFNDSRQMVACMNEALRLLEGGHSCLIRRESEATFGSPHFLYSYYRQPGQLKATVDFIVSEFPIFSRLTGGCSMGCDYVALAEYALETGNQNAAELNAFKAIYKAKTKEQTSIAICANLTLIRLYIYQGKINEAWEQFRQLESDVANENNAIYITTLELIKGYVAACLGRLDVIPAWLQTGDMSPAHFMYQGLAFNYIVYGKAVLLAKDYIRLEILTEEFEQYFSILQNQLGFLHNRIFLASAKYRLYGMEAGCASLRKALDMAREDNIILPFAEYAPNILDMVRHIAHSDSKDAYLQEVLCSCEQYIKSLKSAAPSVASLSARELEILALAADGLKRDEIAGLLHVTAGTVQNHLHNIYQKLEVGGRTAAIKKAQQLKLF